MYVRRYHPQTLGTAQSISETKRTNAGSCGFILKHGNPGPRHKSCQWIHGEPTKSDYRKFGCDRFKCGDPVKEDSAYCDEHHRRTHVPPKPLTEASSTSASNDDGN